MEGFNELMKGEIVIRKGGKVRGIDDLVTVLVLGGSEIDNLGDLIIHSKKGLFRSKTLTYIVDFGIIKGFRHSRAFFSVHDKEAQHTVFIINFFPTKEGGFKARWKCLAKNYSNVCKEILKILRRGFRRWGEIPQPEMKSSITSLNTVGFRLSNAYQKILDGMAEVTLSTALLRYPLIMRLNLKVDNLKDTLSFLEYISRKVGEGRFIILTIGENWRFIIGLNNPQKEYTPSFISFTSGERLLGDEALKRINNLESNEQVKVMVFRIPENEISNQN